MKYLLALVVWVLAIVCVLGASQEWSRSAQLAQRASVNATLARPSVKENPLTAADYQAIQAKIPVFGSVQLQASAQGLTVLATDLSDYAAWRLALDQVLLESPGVRWSVDYLCSGKCSEELAHKAVLSGLRRAIAM